MSRASSPRSPPPSPTLQRVLSVPFYQCCTIRKMSMILLCVSTVLAVSCLIHSIKSAQMTDVMLDYNRRKFVPRGPVAKSAVLGKPEIAWNYQRLIDGIAHKPKCRTSFVHILITSATYHRTERDVIRETWCSKSQLIPSFLPQNHSSIIQCTFLLGQTKDVTTMQSIKKEIKQHDDILLGDYADTYRNLTLKVLTGLHWVTNDCISDYVLKTDDDCFVNSNILLMTLLSHENHKHSMYLGMSLRSLEHITVIRDTGSKWAVTFEEYAPDYYPPYISGTGYLLSQSSASKIYALSKLFVPFPVEDAYIGVLAEYAGFRPQHSYRFTLIRDNWHTCNFLYLILIHHISSAVQREFQQRVHTAYNTCNRHELNVQW